MTYLPEIPTNDDLRAFYENYDEFKTGLRKSSHWLGGLLPAPPNLYVEILERHGGLRGKRLCEFGCATGSFLVLARRAGAAVSGIELNKDAIGVLSRRGLRASDHLRAGEQFEIVCAFEFIEHLPRPGEWLAEVSQALVPDGRLLLALPNGREAVRVGPSWIGFRVDLEHLDYFDVGALARLLEQSCLYIEHYWEARQPSITRPGEARIAESLVARARRRFNLGPTTSMSAIGSFGLTLLSRKA
jgi:SAM-dependent methyltransferase